MSKDNFIILDTTQKGYVIKLLSSNPVILLSMETGRTIRELKDKIKNEIIHRENTLHKVNSEDRFIYNLSISYYKEMLKYLNDN